MNQTQIETKDPFLAAYLLTRYGQTFREARKNSCGETLYIIEGKEILKESLEYRSGKALINPVILRESFSLLTDLVNKTVFGQPALISSTTETEELDLLCDDHKQEDEINHPKSNSSTNSQTDKFDLLSTDESDSTENHELTQAIS